MRKGATILAAMHFQQYSEPYKDSSDQFRQNVKNNINTSAKTKQKNIKKKINNQHVGAILGNRAIYAHALRAVKREKSPGSVPVEPRSH